MIPEKLTETILPDIAQTEFAAEFYGCTLMFARKNINKRLTRSLTQLRIRTILRIRSNKGVY